MTDKTKAHVLTEFETGTMTEMKMVQTAMGLQMEMMMEAMTEMILAHLLHHSSLQVKLCENLGRVRVKLRRKISDTLYYTQRYTSIG